MTQKTKSKNRPSGLRASTRIRIGLLMVCSFLTACSSGRYLTARNNSCRVYDPQPVADQIVDWEGGCENGYATGYGVLSVYEQEKITFRCTGTMNSGQFEGDVIFSVLKDEQPHTEYLENWQDGQPFERIQNLTLKRYLVPAEDARGYLHRLKLFRRDYPDVWIDDFHDVLLAKTVFACNDYTIDETVQVSQGLALEKKDGTGDVMKKKKILRNELLIRITDDGNPDSGYYTLYNHRVASLKQLVSDRYKPGGPQLHIIRLDSGCEKQPVPEELPNSDPWSTSPRHEQKDGGNQKQPEALFFYPVKRY